MPNGRIYLHDWLCWGTRKSDGNGEEREVEPSLECKEKKKLYWPIEGLIPILEA
jgi:hypothetical protein